MNFYVLIVAGLLLAASSSCKPIQTVVTQDIPADIQQVEAEVLKDVDAGMTFPEIVLDIAKLGVADALKMVYDVIATLLDSAHLTAKQMAVLETLHVDAANAMHAAGRLK